MFKWEYRKAWDVLLSAFLTEFGNEDNVSLYILTSSYHSTSDFKSEINKYVKAKLPDVKANKKQLLSRVKLVSTVLQVQDGPASRHAMSSTLEACVRAGGLAVCLRGDGLFRVAVPWRRLGQATRGSNVHGPPHHWCALVLFVPRRA